MSTHEDTDNLRRLAQERLEELCTYLLPGGKKEGPRWLCGSAQGEPGRSFSVNLRTGVFGDWESDDKMQHGAIDLWMRCRSVDFLTAKRQLSEWMGTPVHEVRPSVIVRQDRQEATIKHRPHFNWTVYASAMDYGRQAEFARWRGLSPQYVDWLVRSKHLGAVKNGFALPVSHDGGIVAAHCRITTEDGKALWYYAPALSDIGIGVQPYVLGHWSKAHRIHACESPWDALAIHERLRLYREPLTAVVATRGATNARLLSEIPSAVREVALWPQNDNPGQQWMHVARSFVQGFRVTVAKTPANYGDVGDWVREGATIDHLRQAIGEGKRRSFIQVPEFAIEQYQMAMAPEAPLEHRATFPG